MRKSIFVLLIVLFPFFSFAQETPVKKTAYFFYMDTCPHCHNVDDYFAQSGIYDKYDIVKLDASVPENGQFLLKLYEVNNYPQDQWGGVPVVAFDNKFLIGDTPVIENFLKDMESSQNAYELPNPNADGSAPETVAHEGPIGNVSGAVVPSSNSVSDESEAVGSASVKSGDSGNKKSVALVIIGGLILAVAGALIFVNRDK